MTACIYHLKMECFAGRYSYRTILSNFVIRSSIVFPTRSFPLDCSRTAPNKNRNKFPTFPEPRCRRNSQLRRSSSADRSSGSEASLDSRRRLVIANLHSPYFSVRHSGYSNWYSVLSIGQPCWRGGVYRVMLIGLFEKISSFNHRRHNPGHGETVRMSTCVNPP